MSDEVSVLFVCLGNICRSTMSEGVFQSLTKTQPYKGLVGNIDSCGTAAYHAGDSPDRRTMATLKSHGIKDYKHTARKLQREDFDEFDYIFAMDSQNLQDIKFAQRKRPEGKAKVMLFGVYSGGAEEEVDDPYYGGQEGFQTAYDQAVRFSTNFLDSLKSAKE